MTKSKKTILTICPFASPNIGGVETHLDKLVSELVSDGYYVILITYQPLTTDSWGEKIEKGNGYEIHRMRWFGMDLFPKLEQYFPLQFMYLFPGLFIKSFLYYINNYKKIDIIHAHGLVAATVAVILKHIHKVRIVLSTHAIYDFKRRNLLSFFVKLILSPFDKILAVSIVSQRELIDMGFNAEKIGYFRNWIDTDLVKPHKVLLREPGVKSNEFNILFVGRFIPQKGLRLILEAASELPNITFHFVGTGPLLDEVVSASKKHSNIIYHGILMQSSESQLRKLMELYSSCTYFLSPYLYDEGYSITLIESVSCGTPVIVPDRGSPPTFLDKETTVFLSRIPTVKEIVNVLSRLEKEYSLTEFEKQRKKCRHYAIENFGVKNVKLITDAYEGR